MKEVKDEYQAARDYTLKLLSMYLRTEGELYNKLREKGYSEKVSAELIEELKSQEYIDDKRYITEYIQHQIKNRPCGKFLLIKKLLKKGVSKDLIDEVLPGFMDEKEELKCARIVTERKLPAIHKDSKKKKGAALATFLASRGFSGSVVREILEEEGFLE